MNSAIFLIVQVIQNGGSKNHGPVLGMNSIFPAHIKWLFLEKACK